MPESVLAPRRGIDDTYTDEENRPVRWTFERAYAELRAEALAEAMERARAAWLPMDLSAHLAEPPMAMVEEGAGA